MGIAVNPGSEGGGAPDDGMAMGHRLRRVRRVVVSAALYFVSYFAAVAFGLTMAQQLWPRGLTAGTQFVFWPASGVNLAFLLWLGPRYAPVILLGVLPAIFIMKEPVVFTLLGAFGNLMEGLVAWWIVKHAGRVQGTFDTSRSIAALATASLLAACCATLAVPFWRLLTGQYDGEQLGLVYLTYAFGNGCGIMVLTPFLLALKQAKWTFLRMPWEALAWLLLTVGIGVLAFDSVFQANLNFAFMVFPAVLYAAIRWGMAECAAALLVVMGTIYVAMIRQAAALPEDQAAEVIWFVNAFMWVLAVTGLLVAALVGERRLAEEQRLAAKNRALEFELREERARLDALRYQMNPHFLFNALNSIYAAQPASADVPKRMLLELSDYLRSVVDQTGDRMDPLGEEIESLKKYLAIEEKRHGENLQVTIDVDDKVANARIPNFLLQPLMENAIHHGSEQNRGRLDIRLSARPWKDGVLIEVTNSGAWKENAGHQGVGLGNIRRRLALIYKEEAVLEREPDADSVRVRIRLPVSGDR